MIKKLAWLLMCLFLLVSCGGGTDMASNGVGSGGTGSYTSGPVSGLGSIIVNGVRYDVESADVTDEDGAAFSRNGLKLGMFVEVEGSGITAGSGAEADSSTATLVRVSSDFIGPATDVVSGQTWFKVWGRTINLDSKTVIVGNLSSGVVVSVHGLLASDGYTATRIEVVSTPPYWKVTGRVAGWQPMLRRFNLGLKTFELPPSLAIPSGFGDGAVVRVKVDAATYGLLVLPFLSEIPVQSISLVSTRASNAVSARLKGVVASAVVNGRFEVNGVTVDVSAVSGLNLSTLVDGQRVEVRGRIVNGVLVATTAQIEDDDDVDAREVELHGYASIVSSSLITVRGVQVAYAPSALYGLVGVTEGLCVEVRGTEYNPSRQLIATRIKQESNCRL